MNTRGWRKQLGLYNPTYPSFLRPCSVGEMSQVSSRAAHDLLAFQDLRSSARYHTLPGKEHRVSAFESTALARSVLWLEEAYRPCWQLQVKLSHGNSPSSLAGDRAQVPSPSVQTDRVHAPNHGDVSKLRDQRHPGWSRTHRLRWHDS